ncbi:CocE/NonD family hydrolase [Halosimplex sp. TS25]|uniref:CocE/NonD family hydrolase n=1 Tax=Halosimplex rarum TaxID=3396619 RepID=UPI0039ED7871
MSNEDNEVDAGAHTGSTDVEAVSRRQMLASVTATTIGASAFAGRSVAAPVRVDGAVGDARDTDGVAAVRDEAWVETDVDTDEDDESDRIHVRVSRPESTDEGDQLPVLAVASPYYGEQTHSDATEEMYYDRAIGPSASAGGDGAEGTTAGASEARAAAGVSENRRHSVGDATGRADAFERRYLQQGYAIARISSLGTARSTGCYTAAGPPTIEALESVVDWFNDRATAYDAPTGGEAVTADWTNGRTGMIGASALGELANGLATTGVDGLEAVVPQAANIGQYGLFRANGTPISVVPDGSPGMTDLGTWVQASNAQRPDCERWTGIVEDGQDHETGDYNDFWHERTFLTDADSVECAVLLTHAVDDPIVKPNNVADWYETLGERDVPLKLWLHEGGHTSPRGRAWEALLDRWWAHWLKDVDNGVMDEDPVTVVRGGPSPAEDSPETYEEWPVPGAEPTTVRFGPGGATSGSVTMDESETGTESLVDDPSVLASDLVEAAESDHRLRYETPPLSESVHVSGRVVPSLSLSFDEPTVVSAALVEYTDSGAEIVTRGWADPLNRPSYGEYDAPLAYRESLRESEPLGPDEQVNVEFPLQATDHVFESGSRIGVVVYASDREFTLHPPGNRSVELSLADSAVDLPVVGSESALAAAMGDETGDGTATDETATDETTTDEPTTEPTETTAASTDEEPSETTDRSTETATTGDNEPADGTDEPSGATTSDGGPGFGVGAALAGLAGLGGLLHRDADDGD